jgi:hypothetical protein
MPPQPRLVGAPPAPGGSGGMGAPGSPGGGGDSIGIVIYADAGFDISPLSRSGWGQPGGGSPRGVAADVFKTVALKCEQATAGRIGSHNADATLHRAAPWQRR